MRERTGRCPMTRDEIVDTYFLESRAKLIDIAAFLDRIDRARDATASGQSHDDEDFRVAAFRCALAALLDDEHSGAGGRAQRVLEVFSDMTTEVIPKAPMKGATGAWRSEEG